jgi:PilZ domain
MFASQPERIGTAQGRIEESSRSGWIGGVLASLCLVWLALTGALVYLSSAWAEPQLEIYIGGGLLAVLFFLKRLDSEQRLPHLLFLAISSVIVLRYLFWRVLYTIEFNDWLSFTCAVILFAAELYGIIVFFIGCFINASPITRSPAPLPPPIELSTVDVLVPSYNESPAILEATLAKPFYLLGLVNFLTMLIGIWRLVEVRTVDEAYPIAIALFWGLVNCVLLLAALGALLERRQRRATPRMPASIGATLVTGENEFHCEIADLSLGGCNMLFRDAKESLLIKHPQARLRVGIGDERVEKYLNVRLKTIRRLRATGEFVVGAQFAHESLQERVRR